jgi:hypothetical protein
MFGLREMSIEVPDDQIPHLRRAVSRAVQAKELPDGALSWFFPEKGSGETKTDEPEKKSAPVAPKAKGKPAVNPARPTPKGGHPDRSVGIQPSMDASIRAWDSAAAPKAQQKPASKGTPSPTEPEDDFPNFAPPPSANVDVGDQDDDDYRSPFAGTALDTSEPPPLRGPGLVSRAKQGMKNLLTRDPKKKFDRTMRKMDRDAGPQGALSRIFRGKDVTRKPHKYREEGKIR